jgi:hypothetical protein
MIRADPLVQKLIKSVVDQVNSGKFSVDLVYAAVSLLCVELPGLLFLGFIF